MRAPRASPGLERTRGRIPRSARQPVMGSLYSHLRQQAPHIDKGLTRIVTHPELKALIEAGDPDALHLAFELIQLGAPIDNRIADFSMQAYLEWHPDIVAAGMNPLMHYLRYAMIEGTTGRWRICATISMRVPGPSTRNARRC